MIDILLRSHRAGAWPVPRRFSRLREPVLVVAGGVAANQAIGAALDAVWRESQDFDIRIPPPKLCTDNAAMIAWAGLERFALGEARSARFQPTGALAFGTARLRRRRRRGLAMTGQMTALRTTQGRMVGGLESCAQTVALGGGRSLVKK